MDDNYFVNLAIKEAKKALNKEEIPVGAVIVKNGKIVSKAYNKRNSSNCVKDHAEMLAIDKANKKLKNWRLIDCDIYITLEPCPMCASAIEQSRIRRIITGTSNNNINTNEITKTILREKEYIVGVEEEKCTDLINVFFSKKR